MPPSLHRPPDRLRASPFRVADAVRLGVTQGALRGSNYRRLHRGVYEVADPPSEPRRTLEQIVAERARGYSTLLRPQEAFSHTTALMLAGAPIRTSAELHVSIPLPANRARGAGVVGHRTVDRFNIHTTCEGFVLISPEVALIQSADRLPFRELVIAIDHFLLTPRFGATRVASLSREELAAHLGRSQSRGVRRFRAALELSRDGAESRMETVTRFELARLGIDIFELQATIHSRGGDWIGRFDLVNRGLRLIIEFDGEQHRTDRAQYLNDLQRLEKVQLEGFRVLRLHTEDFWTQNIEQTRLRLLEFVGQQVRQPVPLNLLRFLAEPY